MKPTNIQHIPTHVTTTDGLIEGKTYGTLLRCLYPSKTYGVFHGFPANYTAQQSKEHGHGVMALESSQQNSSGSWSDKR